MANEIIIIYLHFSVNQCRMRQLFLNFLSESSTSCLLYNWLILWIFKQIFEWKNSEKVPGTKAREAWEPSLPISHEWEMKLQDNFWAVIQGPLSSLFLPTLGPHLSTANSVILIFTMFLRSTVSLKYQHKKMYQNRNFLDLPTYLPEFFFRSYRNTLIIFFGLIHEEQQWWKENKIIKIYGVGYKCFAHRIERHTKEEDKIMAHKLFEIL